MANSLVTIVVSLVAMPFYLRYLGMEAYGLIGFYAVLQGASTVLDFGLAPTMSREVARSSAEGRSAGDLLHTLGVVYVGISVVIVLTGLLFASWVARYWLEPEKIPITAIEQVVVLMGFNLACRWPISLYHGALTGAERLAASSAVSMSINVCAAITTICFLAFIAPTIQTFFILQAVFGLLHALVLRGLARRTIGCVGARFNASELRRVWRFSAGMGAIAITSLAFTQLDKALLSSILSLEEFGGYMLAVLIVSGLQVLISPTFSIIYPQFSKLIASGEGRELERIYSLGSRLLAAVLFPAALTLALHAQDIVTIWTGNIDVAVRIAPLIAVLAIGTALNGVMHFPYALQIAYGDTRLPLAINVGLLALLAPLTIMLALSHGAIGGASSWAIAGVIYTLLGTVLTGRRLLPSAGLGWLLRDVGLPLMVSSALVGVGAWIVHESGEPILIRLVIASAAAAASTLASILLFRSTRRMVSELLRQRGGWFPA